MIEKTDVAIIGAGPSGAVAAALLRKYNRKVVVLERSSFPRFSIGESLLPQSMEFLAEADLLDAVNHGGFQYKNGATFARNLTQVPIDFRQKFSQGPGTTFQVRRAQFDLLLAQEAEKKGASIRFGHQIDAFHQDSDGSPVLTMTNDKGKTQKIQAKYVLDASGFGRVLPRLLNLEEPSNFPQRMSVFTHIQDNISDPGHDRDKILIVIHPHLVDVWYWLIPLSNGRCSLGVVAPESYFGKAQQTNEQLLHHAIQQSPDLCALLGNAVYDTPVNQINGYASNVKSLWGDRYALLGNAGEFLDPVFSSGVTIAMKSASLAAPLVERFLNQEQVDWQREYASPLQQGIDTFKTFVTAWYDGSFQQVLFYQNQQPEIKAMITSILAGYAWDTSNPFVSEPQKRLNSLVKLCSQID